MSKLYTIEEAASYLGLTSQTLRNWDKSGKINCVREPENNYRLFSESELDSIKKVVKPRNSRKISKTPTKDSIELKSDFDFKRLITKLHRIIRDFDGRSSIIERFDELTKILLVYSYSDEKLNPILQDIKIFSHKVKAFYVNLLLQLGLTPPKNFEAITLNDQCLYYLFDYLSKSNANSQINELRGVIYEEMIKDIFEKGDNQQFFTPKAVVEFMTDAISIVTSGSICDPASGTGGFLIDIIKNGKPFDKFTAIEVDERLAWITNINLKIHNCKNYKVICLPDGGTLGLGVDRYKSSFDAIITNPPFGSDYSDIDGLKYFTLGQGKSSRRRGVLFIERCLDLLKENGYLAIIIDDGVLNHSSNEDVRRLIINQTEVLGVISLPLTTFMPYASVEASVLLLHKVKKPSKTVKTFFASARSVGKKPNGDEDFIYNNGTEELNNDLFDIFENWKNHINGEEIKNSDLCYISNIFDAFSTDCDTHTCRLDFAFHHYSREAVRIILKKNKHRLVKITDLCDEINESIIPAQDMPDQTILYTGLTHIDSNSETYIQVHTPANSLKSAVKKYQKGDVIFSKMRPNLKKSVAINHENDGYCSSECIVLRPKNNHINSRLLSAVLRSDFVYGQIVHLITGIGRPRISAKDFKGIMIPLISESNKVSSLENYEKTICSANELQKKAKDILQQSITLKHNSTNQLIENLLQ